MMTSERKTYFLGWKCDSQPRYNDILTVKKNNVTKSQTPANIVYNSFTHTLYFPDNMILVEGKMEYLLNNKPIPSWIKPQFIDRVTIKKMRWT